MSAPAPDEQKRQTNPQISSHRHHLLSLKKKKKKKERREAQENGFCVCVCVCVEKRVTTSHLVSIPLFLHGFCGGMGKKRNNENKREGHTKRAGEGWLLLARVLFAFPILFYVGFRFLFSRFLALFVLSSISSMYSQRTTTSPSLPYSIPNQHHQLTKANPSLSPHIPIHHHNLNPTSVTASSSSSSSHPIPSVAMSLTSACASGAVAMSTLGSRTLASVAFRSFFFVFVLLWVV
jgi:hypothetical protein